MTSIHNFVNFGLSFFVIKFQTLQIFPQMDRLNNIEKALISNQSTNKVAIVTGSLSGIGLGIANALAKRNYNIVLNGLTTQEDLEKVEKHFKTTYPNIKAHYIYADLTQPLDCKLLVRKTIEVFGRVDVLVNNAGMQFISSVADFPDNKWEEIISLNLSSAFYLSKQCIPHMLKNSWGRIINISSVHGLVASVNKSAYVASKHGIIGFTKATALEYAKHGITSNAICPGWVLTPLIEKQIDIIAKRDNVSKEQASKKLVEEKQPSGKFSSVDDVGELTAFLVSDNARQVNGAAWTMDGAWTAQ